MQIIFSGPFGITELMLVCFEYTILLKPALGGMRDVALFSISHEQTQKKNASGLFLPCMISLLLKDLLFRIYLVFVTSTQADCLNIYVVYNRDFN